MNTYTPELDLYFGQIEKEVKEAYDKAEMARKKGYDPEEKVDIPLAKGIAQRVLKESRV